MTLESFKILNDAEHILLRPNMYIGSVSIEDVNGIINGTYQTKKVVPGLIKIINEILDNSLDEFIRTDGKHANKINVDIINENLSGWSVTVEDNGRGIPVVKHGDTWQAELCWTRAKAGTNFSDNNRITVGMNGVGSFCTNVFSTKFTGESSDGKDVVRVVCHNNCSKVSTTVASVGNKRSGTSVKFYPELSRFGLEEITSDHIELIEDRLVNLTICYPGLTFKLNGKTIKAPTGAQIGKMYHENSIVVANPNFTFVIAPSGVDQEFRHLSYLNGLNIKNGGSHVDFIVQQIASELQPVIKKKWKIEVLPNHIKQHLLIASWVRNFPNPKFDSQTKERITNTASEVKSFMDFDANKIAKQIVNTPDIIDPIVAAILYKKQLADQLALARQAKAAKKLKIENHIAANSNNPEEKILFITEGLSAIGPLIAVRDANKVGGYSLKGKVMNTRGMKPVDIVKNKEIFELMAVIGLEFGKEPDLNYGKIAIMTDMDVDGAAIFSLLLNFFSNWPTLFTDKRIYRVLSPRYIVTKGKTRTMYYNDADYQAARVSAGSEVDYIKGLGSLNKSDYKSIINDPQLVCIGIETVEDLDSLEMAFGDNSNARKEWLLSE